MGQSSRATALYERRKNRVRYKLRKLAGERMRLTVHRSNQHIYAQIINDLEGKTLVVASSVDKEVRKTLKHGGNIDAARVVGELVAKRAKDAKISKVVFDRGGYLYHGRVKALADAAREGGLEF